MAFCPNCGTKVADNAAFCENCGAKLADFAVQSSEEKQTQTTSQGGTYDATPTAQGQSGTYSAAPQSAQQGNYDATPQTVQSQTNYEQGLQYQKPELKLNKKVVGIILAILVLVGVGVGAYFYIDKQNRTVNIEDYVKVDFTGCDGYGEAKATLNDEFVEKINEVAEKKEDSVSSKLATELGETFAGSAGKLVAASIHLSCDPDKNLKNGDSITVTWNKAIAKKLADTYNIILTGEKKKVKVKGLDKVKEVDPFAAVTVEFSGIDGFIKANIVNKSTEDYLKTAYFHFDNGGMTAYNLKVGDSLTVTVDEVGDLTSKGIKYKTTSKTFTVEGADRYAAALTDLQEASVEKMKAQAMDVLESRGEDDDDFTYAAWDYVGNYILVRKNVSEYGTNNYVVLVYKGKVTYHDDYKNKDYHKTVYVPVVFQNVLVKTDGSNSFDETSARIDFHSMTVHEYIYYRYGYENLRDIYKAQIKANKAEYNSDMSDAFSSFND
ncbi:MAG: zinc-ribbon domain-containing protein [Lachnospiraceae bacterium]|jgi:hypothetical protein|nr:zinc-ribbon domain-containing protein [Lachnospiraceae bacterium]